MPEVSRFFGIVIRIFFNDHDPPHFHAVYGGDEALIEIESLAVYLGELPRRALVESNGKLIAIFEAKIKAKLDEIWGEDRTGKDAPGPKADGQ